MEKEEEKKTNLELLERGEELFGLSLLVGVWGGRKRGKRAHSSFEHSFPRNKERRRRREDMGREEVKGGKKEEEEEGQKKIWWRYRQIYMTNDVSSGRGRRKDTSSIAWERESDRVQVRRGEKKINKGKCRRNILF